MSSDLFKEGLRHAWRELVSLNRKRAETEAEIEREHTTARAAAECDLQDSQKKSDSQHKAEYRAGERAYRDAVKQSEEAYEKKIERTRRAHEVELRIIEEKAEHSQHEAKKKLEEALWLAETVYEAGQGKPQIDYDKRCDLIKDLRQRLETTETDADTLLRRYRQKRPSGWRDTPAQQPPADDAIEAFTQQIQQVETDFASLRKPVSPRFFAGIRLPALIVLVVGGAGAFAAWRDQWQFTDQVKMISAATAGGMVVFSVLLYLLARARTTPRTAVLQGAIARGHHLHGLAVQQAADQLEADKEALLSNHQSEMDAAHHRYEPILSEITSRRQRHLQRIEDKYPELLDDLQSKRAAVLQEAEASWQACQEESEKRLASEQADAMQRFERREEEFETRYKERWQLLTSTWQEGTQRIHSTFQNVIDQCQRLAPPWHEPSWHDWSPPHSFAPAIRFGELHVDMLGLEGGISKDPRLAIPWPQTFQLPATLVFPDACSMMLETGDLGGAEAIATLQTIMFRLLTSLPPGKVRFTIIDPVGLGQNFAGFMHLADSLESLVTDRIWTETRHIEQRLTDLTDHMENVIQKYLRNEYESIGEYNEKAGEIAEPYRFLVIADFPVNFSEAAAKRLASIVTSGPRCGVQTLIVRDQRQGLPKGIELADLQRDRIVLEYGDDRFTYRDEDYEQLPLTVDPPPTSEFMIPRLRLVGEAAKESSRVEVPFHMVSPPGETMWESSTASELHIPMGRLGATSLQRLELGRGTSQHVLIAGKTGSGKSTLLHVLITNAALWYSPDELEMYLIDFKKGVEFKAYATYRLPHARAVAIESDREFGLSVLQRLDGELKRRGDLFRSLGVQDLAGYRNLNEDMAVPRTLLIIDEFQEFFIEDDRIAQEASLLMDRLVRQGRAFGIHVILGSQTLGGAYSLAKSTMGQMAVRIALQCSESDSYLILSEDNSAARLLARPGEAIYNNASGRIEGNSPFQIVWLPDEVRDEALERIQQRFDQANLEPMEQIVFEGNAPANIRNNHRLRASLRQPAEEIAPITTTAWLGEAVAIKDPTAAVFRRQSASHLLVVGQREELAVSLMTTALASLATAHRAQTQSQNGQPACFNIFDGVAEDSPHAGWADRVRRVIPHSVAKVQFRETGEALQAIVAEMERRNQEHTPVPPLYLCFNGIQRFRDLRLSDDFSFSMDDDDKPPSPDKLFRQILSDGPLVGIHTLIWCDSATNVDRILDRKMMREFDMRVVFQMSAADSTNLIDSPAANKLGLQHALFYSEERGVLEKFRPYGAPDASWYEEVAAAIT